MSDVVNMSPPIMIVPRLDKLLAKKERTFYWLAKETGVSHTTLWRLKKGKAVGINFETLEKICRALRCQPGDVLFLTNSKTHLTRRFVILIWLEHNEDLVHKVRCYAPLRGL